MSKRKRHSTAEVAAKLAEADVLIAQGKRQIEIARALGISVMTFHRWRKAAQLQAAGCGQTPIEAVEADEASKTSARIAELQLENSRLRRLVTDLLLEKTKLEEALPEQDSSGAPVRHASH